MLDKRLNDKGKNWRHVLKALKVLDYCLHEGSELVVTWGKQNIYIIKTLREFMYIDEEGRDVGQNSKWPILHNRFVDDNHLISNAIVRVAAKELSSLLLDEERLRAERSDRKSWKSRVTGLDEYGPQSQSQSQDPPRRRERRQHADEDDAEYKLALEASRFQEEEDRKKRESRHAVDTEDDDLAKAIKLSKEEEEARRRQLEEQNAQSLFDDTPTQPQPTGWNQGYTQGSGVDFFGNPIDQSQMQPQPTGYMQNAYTGFGTQPTGFQNGFQNGFGQQQPIGFDPYGQQQQQQQAFQPQPTGYNPYAQQQIQPQPTEATLQPGSNNPWATNNQAQGVSSLTPMKTGSNNPFAQQASFSRPQQQQQQQPYKMPSLSVLNPLPEQKTLSTFQQPQPTSFTPPPPQPQPPQKELSEHEAKLNALLAGSEGQDTFGNVGQLRIPAQHTAPGTFVNSAGAGLNKLTVEQTGNNPFLRQQFTGMPTVSYGATGPAGLNGGFGGQSSSNPFGARPQQQQNNQGGDLIQF